MEIGFIVIILLLPTLIVEGVRFDIESGVTKCISDDIKINSMTVGEYSAVNPNEEGHPLPDHHKIYVALFSEKGTRYYHEEDVESGQFALEVVEDGKHMVCFATINHEPVVNTSIEFNWRSGVVTKGWSKVAKKGSVDAMEIELKKMEYTVKLIHWEMYFLREREEGMLVQNMKTNSMMGLLSLVSLFLSLSVAGLQFWHLKSFFEKKKII